MQNTMTACFCDETKHYQHKELLLLLQKKQLHLSSGFGFSLFFACLFFPLTAIDLKPTKPHGFSLAPLPSQNGDAVQNTPTLLQQPNSEVAVSSQHHGCTIWNYGD